MHNLARQVRRDKAASFRLKSEESLTSAKECFERGLYRSACNRAYYAVYQLLNAGMYANTQFSPEDFVKSFNKRTNFPHDNVGSMLDKIFNHCSKPSVDQSIIFSEIQAIRKLQDRRERADYTVPDNGIESDTAKNQMDDAERIILLISKLFEE